MSKTPKRVSLESEYRKLAKRADQRLLRLEELAKKPGFESVKQYAWKRAQRDIRSWSGEKATRFNTAPPSNTNQLKAKIADIKRFLSSASSTFGSTRETKGIYKIYQERANTINEKLEKEGIAGRFTWQDLAQLFESGLWEKLKNSDHFSSKSDFETLARIKGNFTDVAEAIRENENINIEAYDDVENFAINEMISTYGTDIIKALR